MYIYIYIIYTIIPFSYLSYLRSILIYPPQSFVALQVDAAINHYIEAGNFSPHSVVLALVDGGKNQGHKNHPQDKWLVNGW